jgi:hypothetical protein
LKEVEKLLPKRILICNNTENIDGTQVIIKENQMSDAQKNKIELIKLIKEVYQKVGSIRAIARTLKLNRKTVKIYIDTENVIEDSKYNSSKRKVFLIYIMLEYSNYTTQAIIF